MYKLFDNRIFVFVVFSSIAVIASQNWIMGAVVGLLFAMIMHKLNQTKMMDDETM
jgi:hypothetical protein